MPLPAILHRQSLVWGTDRVRSLERAHVLIAGVGGLGCVVAEQLVRSGVGELSLIDDGLVEASNLGRQVLYGVDDIGSPKVTAAARQLCRINPALRVRTCYASVSEAGDLFGEMSAHVVTDCLDNYPARFALEHAVPPGMTFVHGAVEEERGQVVAFKRETGCFLRHLFFGAPDPPSPLPVIPQCCAIVGSYQSLSVLRCLWALDGLLPEREALYSVLTLIDVTTGEHAFVPVVPPEV